jgi:hypothetical protein
MPPTPDPLGILHLDLFAPESLRAPFAFETAAIFFEEYVPFGSELDMAISALLSRADALEVGLSCRFYSLPSVMQR